jgi:hypothetical protein
VVEAAAVARGDGAGLPTVPLLQRLHADDQAAVGGRSRAPAERANVSGWP